MKPLLILATLLLPLISHSGEIPTVESVVAELAPKISEQKIAADKRWRKPRKIYVVVPNFYKLQAVENFDTWLGEGLDTELVFVESPAALRAQESEIEALVGFCSFLDGDYPQLSWIQNLSAGVEGCVANKQFNNDRVIVANGAATSGPGIAEWVIGSMFMMQRNFLDYYRAQQERNWLGYNSGLKPAVEVNKKTILIVGLGGIGKQIAWRAKGLGMTVLATRNSSREGPGYVDYVGLADELLELAARADVVVNAAPLTDKTRGLFDKAFFNTMPQHGLFINVGRGGSVQQAELIEALKSGAIKAAALDVTDPEPLPAESELWAMPNVFISPHNSSFTAETSARRWVFMKENLRRLAQGEQVYNIVDLQRGY
ncbi:MAG: D-2-hydroxyacid dehydrogenase [Gammaproteobacteria bacterium]|nr:D-2-hydroxyacid dehydrogenase [Gammaproteobacteria bacterium]